MQEFIRLANRMADEAGKIIRQYYRRPYDIDAKDDKSPVTIADKTVELKLRDILAQERPDDGIIGEEFAPKESANDYTWVLDPIDGTKPFITGRPTFGTLIALCRNGLPVLGVIDQPVTGDRWLGADGHGTLFNGQPCRTRDCRDFTHAISATTAPGMFDGLKPGFVDAWRGKGRFIVWGGDCVSYGSLASGWVDLVIEAQLMPHDFLAVAPVIRGAGGIITDWNGKDLGINSDGRVIAAGTETMWEQGRELLSRYM